MKDQINTIREALEVAHDESLDGREFRCRQILMDQIAALTRIEAMAGEPWLDERGYTLAPLHTAAPVAQQPQAEAVPDVVQDADRLNWLLMQVSGKEFRRIGVEYSGNCQRADIDAAIAQQKGNQ